MSTIRLALLCVLTGCASAHSVGEGAARADARAARGSRELTRNEQVAHVLSRLAYGPRPGDLDRVAAMGVDRWIDMQLRPDSIDDGRTDVILASMPAWSQPPQPPQPPPVVERGTTTTTTTVSGQVITTTPLVVRSLQGTVNALNYYAAGKIVLAQTSERQLREVITDFWENHFSMFSGKMPAPQAYIDWDRDVLRPRALGKFRELLGASMHSAAMLHYLDNHLSKKGALNENYARELLELHTLGVDGGYTQQDVIEVARALTGWGYRREAPRMPGPVATSYHFNPAVHDSAAKTILGVDLPAGRGYEDGEQVLDILARHPSTARYISYKLARRLVSDDPPPALVKRAAATFTRTDGDIAEVVRTIVTSPEFFSRAAFRAKVKTPFDLVVSTARALEVPADTSLRTVNYLRTLGQPVFGRQTPEGWPEHGSAWINAGAMMQRFRFAEDVAMARLAFMPLGHWRGWSLSENDGIDRRVDGVVRAFLAGIASPATRSMLDGLVRETAATNTATDSRERMRDLLAVAIGSPEYQRR